MIPSDLPSSSENTDQYSSVRQAAKLRVEYTLGLIPNILNDVELIQVLSVINEDQQAKLLSNFEVNMVPPEPDNPESANNYYQNFLQTSEKDPELQTRLIAATKLVSMAMGFNYHFDDWNTPGFVPIRERIFAKFACDLQSADGIKQNRNQPGFNRIDVASAYTLIESRITKNSDTALPKEQAEQLKLFFSHFFPNGREFVYVLDYIEKAYDVLYPPIQYTTAPRREEQQPVLIDFSEEAFANKINELVLTTANLEDTFSQPTNNPERQIKLLFEARERAEAKSQHDLLQFDNQFSKLHMQFTPRLKQDLEISVNGREIRQAFFDLIQNTEFHVGFYEYTFRPNALITTNELSVIYDSIGMSGTDFNEFVTKLYAETPDPADFYEKIMTGIPDRIHNQVLEIAGGIVKVLYGDRGEVFVRMHNFQNEILSRKAINATRQTFKAAKMESTEKRILLTASAISQPRAGNLMRDNEDKIVIFETNNGTAIVLADGMGGQANGKQAATLVVDFVSKAITDDNAQINDVTSAEKIIKKGVKNASRRITGSSGATLLSAVPLAEVTKADGRVVQQFSVTWLGDSIGYKYDGMTRKLERVTTPHIANQKGFAEDLDGYLTLESRNKIQDLLDTDPLPPEIYKYFDNRHLISASVTGPSTIGDDIKQVETVLVELSPGDRLILTSDGMEALTSTEIEQIITQCINDGLTDSEIISKLLEAADNVPIAFYKHTIGTLITGQKPKPVRKRGKSDDRTIGIITAVAA